MAKSVAVAGFGANGVRRSRKALIHKALFASTALVGVVLKNSARASVMRKTIIGVASASALLVSQNVAAHTDALGFIIGTDPNNPGKYSAEIIYGTYNHGGTPSAEGSAQVVDSNNVVVATQAFALIPNYVNVANGVIPSGLVIGTNYFFVNSSTGGLVTTPYGSGTSQFQAATFTNLSAGTYTFGYVAGALTQQWTPLSPAINAGSFTITATGNLGGIGGVTITPDIDTAVAAYTTTQLAAGGVNPNFTGGTLTVASTASVANNFTLGTGGGTVNTNASTLTTTGTVADSGATPGSLTVTGGGRLVLSGNNTYTGGTVVNGGALQLNSTTAAGTGAIHMVDPTLMLNAAGTYANEIRLEVAAPASGDPTVIQNTSGGLVNISGQVHETGVGGPNQYVTFDGGSTQLSNTANSWTGVTQINANTTLTGTNQTISGGSITDNGALVYNQTGAGTVAQAIQGTGSLALSGGGILTLTGANTFTGGTTVSGSTLVVGGTNNGLTPGATGSITGPIALNGSNLIFSRTGNYVNTSAISGVGASTVFARGTVELDGNISMPGGVVVDLPSSAVVLGGTVNGNNTSADGGYGSAVLLASSQSNSTLTVASTGQIQSGSYIGVRVAGQGDSVTNLGSITNTGTGGTDQVGAGVAVYAVGGATTITNGSAGNTTASISGQNNAINQRNGATSTVTVNNFGTLKGNDYNAIENSGTAGALTVNNTGASATIYGQGSRGGGAGISDGNSALLTVVNSGRIVGSQAGIVSNGVVAITNSGTIGTGSVNGAGTYTASTSGFGLNLGAGGTITNNSGGVIRSSYGIYNNDQAALNITNAGSISGTNYGIYNGTNSNTTTSLVTNTGTISANTVAAIYFYNGGTVANNVGGTISGGNDASGGYAVLMTNGTDRVDNNATITGGAAGAISAATFGAIVLNLNAGSTTTGAIKLSYGAATESIGGTVNGAFTMTNGGASTATDNFTVLAGGVINGGVTAITTDRGLTLDSAGSITGSTNAINDTGSAVANVTLRAGSVTSGGIVLGSGADTLTLYNGQGTANGGTLNAASLGAVDLGGGTNTLMLRGAGDGTGANGAVGTLNVSTLANATQLVKQDAGTWMITGTATSHANFDAPIANNNFAGGTSVLAGTLAVETDTSTYGSNALGNGTVAISSGATVRYDNPFTTAAPGVSGAQIYISGNTFTGSGTLAFAGATGSLSVIDGVSGAADVAMASSGTIAVQSGSVLARGGAVFAGNQANLDIATGASFDGGSGAAITVNALTGGGSYVGNGLLTVGVAGGSGTFSGTIGNEGGNVASLTKTGAGTETLTGVNTYTGATTISAGTLVLSGTGSMANTAVTDNATFSLAGHSGNASIASLAGAGTVELSGNTLTVGSDNTNTTFSGVIQSSFTASTTYVGNYSVGAGPSFTTVPTVYSGQGAAALLFGGVASDYSISTLGSNPATINHLAYLDGYGDSRYLTNPAAENYSLGDANGKYNYPAFSAYVRDHSTPGQYVNYVFRVTTDNDGLTKTGTGTLTLTGANTYTGTTMVSGGTLQGTTTSIVGSSIVDNATLAYNQSASGSVAQGITGSGVVTVTGLAAGNAITFAGANSQAGGFQVTDASTAAFTGTDNGAATEVTLLGAGTLVNTGTITGTATGVAATGGAGTATVVNASTGTIAGASYGVRSSGAGALALTNYGTITGPLSVLSTGANVLSLRSGSTTGAVTTGGGNDTLVLYTGFVTTNPVVDATTGLTLRPAGTFAATSVGAIDLGAGANVLNLRGAGDGSVANGAAATIGLNMVSNVGTITKQDAGTWTLTGAATASVAAATINAGIGGTPGSGGLLVFSGSGLSGTINVNGATIRATAAGAFGTGTINAIDPTIQYGASGTYANQIVLQSANPATDPTTLQTYGTGITATLTGAITQTNAPQPLVFSSINTNGTPGTGTFVLTNAGNAWTGVTTVNAGTTLRGTTASLSGGSFTDNGVLNFNQATAGTSARAISGTGNVVIDGGGTVALTGAITASGGVQVGANTTATLSNVSGTGITTVTLSGNNAVLNVASGGTIAATNGGAVFGVAQNGTVNNAGTITSTGGFVAVNFNANTGTDTVTNTGSITGGNAVASGSTLNLTNSGTLTGQTGTAVFTASGSNAATIVNSGTIQGGSGSNSNGISLNGGGTVTNNAGGLIAGTLRGVSIGGASSTVNNYGQITGGTDNAVALYAGGNATNFAGGTLTATSVGGWGVYTAGAGTIDNQGTVNADSGLVSTSAATVFTNEGTITAAQNGVWGYGTSVNLANTGTITGGGAMGTAGVRAEAAGSSITNGGTIAASSTAGVGVYLTGGTLTNQSGGTISGGAVAGGGYGTAIQLAGTGNVLNLQAGSTVNGLIDAGGTTDASNGYTFAGTINGGFTGGSGDDTVTLVSPATVTGMIDGGAGTDTLVLDGTATGTLGSAQVVNFENAVKQGSGTWTLTGTTAASPTSVAVNAGTLAVGGGDALSDTSAVTIASGATLQLNDSETIGSLGGAGNVTLGANTLTTGGLNASPTFSGVASGTGGLTKVGTGTLTLSGANTYSGATTVNAGTLALGATNTIGAGSAVTVASGAILDLTSYNDTVASLALSGTLNGTGTLTASTYTLSGATVNANLGAGTLTQAGGTSTLNGTAGAATVTVNGGTLALGASDRLADNAALSVASGATLNMGAFTDTVGTAALSGTLNGTGTLTASTYTLSGAAVNANLGAGTLTQAGGTSTLNGTAGATTVNVNGGTLALGASNRLADTATVTIASGAALNMGAFTDTVGLARIAGTLSGTGTLSAAEYDLAGAVVNANLGTGNLFQQAGTSTLNGTAGAANVMVTGGTLVLGASNRLADNAAVGVATGATLNLGTFTDTVGTLALNGTLAGTGTLTASTYTLNGAAVNANLGTGTLVQAGGTSVLSGTAATNMVAVMAGTLRLGASDRIADAATLGVATGATFDLAGYNETVGTLAGGGTLSLGAGTLTAGGTNADYAFGGNVTGTGDLTKVGTGTFSLIGKETMTGRLNVNAGTVMLAGTTAGSVRIQGGTLTGASAIAGNLLLSSGTLSPGTSTQPVAAIQAGSLTVTGGTTVFDFGGMASGFTADLLKVTGAATLTGGTVTTRGLDPSAAYKMEQTYTIVQAGALTGTYANGATFAQVSNNADLYYRLRYDLVANGVVLEIRKPVDFTTTLGAGATGNQLSVAAALNGGVLTGSDSWAATLNAISQLSPDQRRATLDNIGGESTADISTSVALIGDRFNQLLRHRLAVGGAGNSADPSLIAGIAGGKRGLDQVRAGGQVGAEGSSFADGSTNNQAGAWVQTFGGAGRLTGSNGTATISDQSYGVAAGIDAKVAGLSIGGAFAASALDTRVEGRNATNRGTLYQGGGYVAYDSGTAYASAVGSYFSGDVDSSRQVYIGAAFQGNATGTSRVTGYTAGGAAGYRLPVGGGGVRFTPQVSVQATHVNRDAFTETGAGGLSLSVGKDVRNLYTATAEGRLSYLGAAPGGIIEPYAGAGVAFNFGDLDTLSANRFTGAPTGTGAFTVAGARLSPTTALINGGIEAHPNDRVTLGMGVETRLSNRERDGRLELHVRLGF